MIASRNLPQAIIAPTDTACPPRRSFVAGDARRRGQPCTEDHRPSIAFGAALPTPAMLAGMDNTGSFTLIADT